MCDKIVHLHCHTQYSLLDGASDIKKMVSKAKKDGQKAIAITDHGHMGGVFKFVGEANRQGIKPIAGCEFYMVQDRTKLKFTKDDPDRRYHQLLLAKNATGYANLCRLNSEGHQYKYQGRARIDKEVLKSYSEGLLATSCCLGAIIPQKLLSGDLLGAEEELKWWLDLFGEDFYIELQDHDLPEQHLVNEHLLAFAKKYNVKTIVTNDVHYVDQQDAEAHDTLLCINTGSVKSIPIGKGENFRAKGYRFGFANDNFYLKTTDEMLKTFPEHHASVFNTMEVADKVDPISLTRDILLPHFPLPKEYDNEYHYLYNLTYQGAKERYGKLTGPIRDRLNYELNTIRNMGFEGYFLVTADFINAAKDMGVYVGPGRGSVAGSMLAYCLGITDIDPLRYGLLFERFLNPDRISMPDIDTDFDDEGRSKVIDYVTRKYGQNNVAQIATYGTMGARMAIRDVARVSEVPISEADVMAKLIPSKHGVSYSIDEAISEVPQLSELYNTSQLHTEVLDVAKTLEGGVRNEGVHAAGVIISPVDLLTSIPLTSSKDSNLLVSQYDGKDVEKAGFLKMDFLGLKTLSVLKDTCEALNMTLEDIPMDDPLTYRLFAMGETVGVFQFESGGMRNYLQQLQPTTIDDLIAMNALYRPGPMQFIDSYIARKHGKEEVEYIHPLLEPVTKDTYGILIYQEQIMECARVLAGYTGGQADLLRRAMGKKDPKEMEENKQKFINGCKETTGLSDKESADIFAQIETFAAYGFNKSHSAAYSVLAYYTGYLKAHHPDVFMTAVLNHAIGNTDDLEVFVRDCERMGITIIPPTIHSPAKFEPDYNGSIYYGLSAIKGIGTDVAEAISGNKYNDIFDLLELKEVNRKVLVALAKAGAFEEWYSKYDLLEEEELFISKMLAYRQTLNKYKNSKQTNLFGLPSLEKPEPPYNGEYSDFADLKLEEEALGFYLTSHPLDVCSDDYERLKCTPFADMYNHPDKTINVGGMINEVIYKKTKTGKDFIIMIVEDFSATEKVFLFGQNVKRQKELAIPGNYIKMQGKVKVGKYTQFKPEKFGYLEFNERKETS